MQSPDGSLSGFDVEVARAYAEQSGRRLELVPFRWPDLERRLLDGDFDVAMGGVTVRGDRLARAPMTMAVARADAVVLVRPGTDASAVDRPGKTVVVNRGGHLEKLARARFTQATLRTTDDNRALPAILEGGQADAIVTDTMEERSFAGRFEVAEVLSRDRKAYWVAPDEPELAVDLDEWLVASDADGTLTALRVEYLGGDPQSSFTPAENRLLDLIARRLLLMPWVAEAKRRADLPVEAPAREAEIEKEARVQAKEAELDPDSYVAFVRAQIEAAKAVQRAVLEMPASSGDIPNLVRDLRPAIDRIDASILAELERTVPVGASVEALNRALRELAPVPGVDDETMAPVAEALRPLRRANS